MTAKRSRRRADGFTLIEVLLVLVILVVLASFAVLQFTGVRRKANLDAARTQVGLFRSGLQTYEVTVGFFPTSLDALRTCPSDLQNPSKWAGPYLDSDIPLDPWGNPYQYACPGTRNPDSFDVWSFGPDMQNGTDDDIGNWNMDASR
jgi:general secretion pathway protein G